MADKQLQLRAKDVLNIPDTVENQLKYLGEVDPLMGNSPSVQPNPN